MKKRGSNLARDVYRDLRDRRLLSIAVVLVIAIVAVPFLMKGEAEPLTPSASSASAAMEGGEALDPVVVPASTELRDYRRRLDAFQERNPFKQQFTQPVGGELTDTSVVSETESSTTVSEELGGSSLGETSAETSTDTTTETAPTDVEPDESEDSTEADADTDDETPESVLYSTRIDVRVGPAGNTKVVKDVKELAYLPDSQAPVVQHLFGQFDLTSAAFVVSPEAVADGGDGRCEPAPADCQFLMLEVGEKQRFLYREKSYSLELLEVNLHEQTIEGDLPVDDGGSGGSTGFAAERAPSDLTGR